MKDSPQGLKGFFEKLSTKLSRPQIFFSTASICLNIVPLGKSKTHNLPDIVNHTVQHPLNIHLNLPPQRKAVHPLHRPDMRKHRLHDPNPLMINLPTPLRIHLPPHLAFPNPILLKTDFTPVLSIINPFFLETKISFPNENIPRNDEI